MKINLDGLTEQELIALNREIVERIKMIRQLRTQGGFNRSSQHL
jgi:hypothetical protein